MPEENQIQMNQTSTPMNSNIRERLSGLRSFREGAVLRKAKQTQDTLDADSNNLFEQSLNVNNKELSQRYNQASQSAAAASMIKSYAEKNGDDWSDLNTPQEILTEYFTLNPDDETYNKIMDFTQSNRDPEEFGLEMGWIEPIKETFMDKAKDSIVGPFARAIGALGGGVYGLGEGIYEASKRPGEFTQRQKDRGYIVEDQNSPTGYSDGEMNFKDKVKRYGKFFGTLGNMLGDVVGGTMMGAAGGFATNQEKEAVKDKVAEVAAAILNSEPGEKVQALYNGLDDSQKEELKDWASIIDGISDLPLSVFGGKVAKEGVKQTIKAANSELVERGVKSIDDVVENAVNKRLIKNKPQNIEDARRLANIIGQGEVEDIDNSVNALRSILKTSDAKGINDFKGLRDAGSKRVDEISKTIDDNLSKQKGVIKLSDQHVVMVNGEEQGKVIEDAINDLIDVYSKQRKPDKVNKVLDFQERVADGVSYKEMNDFAREYGSVMDAWNKKNELTTNAKVGTEQTRKGIKDLIRERVPDEEFKNLDAEMGSILNFNKLVDNTVKKINNVEKKLRDKGILEEVREAWSELRSTIRGDLRGDTDSIYDIQGDLSERLEMFNDLIKDIDKAESAENIKDAVIDASKAVKKTSNPQ